MTETERLSKHILDLQKDKGDLTDENKVLKQNLEDSEIVNKSLTDRVANLEYQLEGRDNEIKELKAQIEKMKKYTKCEGCIHQEEHLQAIVNGKQGSAFCMLECNAFHSSFELKE
jgi:predicted RNase H-like nuclease (RuvC/YqgF family)